MRILKILIIVFFVSSCTKNKADLNQFQKSQKVIEQKSSEDFDSFFKSFSLDKNFRLMHIKFPLKGFNSDESEFDSLNKPYLWKKEDWIFYSEEDFKTGKTKDEVKTDKIKKDSLIIYRIFKENSGYDIQYTFKKIDNKWNLIYYSYKNF
ncbi:hypothetical protein ASE21_08690 [Flavobacterium sp. Root901]|uniref:hypothetical protein n=1 Tax=Flavobacterium sp. Root901 TaxID=1736605 RepID=UPI000709CA25|nr:hypothetical protein [Flavobacterium sp. Root901]KRD11762.1 hypothetical protein ASE21_08690 [Flavobacterium sp. Root901]